MRRRTKESKAAMNTKTLKFRHNQQPLRPTNMFTTAQKPQQFQFHRTKPNLFIIGLLTSAIVAFCCFYYSNYGKANEGMKRYRIVIDGGSTGSRVHVFEYRIGNEGVVFDFGGKGGLNSMRVGPGLSAFKDDEAGAGESVSELLEFAKMRVPEEEWAQTEVRLMATAGLRLLEVSVQERILEACRKVLRRSGFEFRDDWWKNTDPEKPSMKNHPRFFNWASVISGSDEGLYAWVVANYALGTLGGDPHETTGIIELGGASAQVTFFSSDPIPPEYSKTVKFGNVSYSLYSHSLLEYGQNVAFDLIRESKLAKFSNQETFGGNEPMDPCWPKGYEHNLIIEKTEQSSVLRASGNFSECRSASLTLLQKGKDECAYEQCYIGSTFIPKLEGHFLATENIFYTSKFFGLSPKTFLSELTAAGTHFCQEDWSKLKSKYPKHSDDDLHRYCFSSAYIVALLHDSLGIAFDAKRIAYANQANSIPLDWAFGAFILQIMSELHIKQTILASTTLNEHSSILGGVFFVNFMLFTIYCVSKWRKPNVKTIFDLEKGKYIFTRIARHS
ncbi:putative apyrase 6 [Bidens hawaiensis]|uniref:putative apyrase 6 n=1 Tax=Bidens hawaiensis TaxID=980011 RepID=UPI00404A9EF7